MKKEKIFIVIPTIRDLSFLKEWKKQFANVRIIVCEDRPQKSIKIPKVGKEIHHYSWQEIDDDLGKDSWTIPRKVSAIRNYGFLKAHQMGADIIMCDPHRVIINGPSQLIGRKLTSPDLRAGFALVLAGLVAEGETEIDNIYQIDRGYERIEERLQALGANIKREEQS